MKAILTLNTGSSSLKFTVFGLSADLPFLVGGIVKDIGGKPTFSGQLQEGVKAFTEELPQAYSHEDAAEHVLRWIDGLDKSWTIEAAAHRIVHGGRRYSAPALIDAEAMAYLHSICPLAPLHQPHNLAGIEILEKHLPHLPQYGCFDTAFHTTHDALCASYALPASVRDKGVQRYGFHGLSYEWLASQLKQEAPALYAGRVVAAHLGNGSSLCALKEGKSVDSTMGMTALEGLPMGTRCGNIDAGAVFFMQRTLGLSVDECERVLYNDSGLKGLSGISNDVKTLLDSTDARAAFALDYYALKVAQQITSMAVSMGGIDAVVFTGGIGENAAPVREKILAHLKFLPPFEVRIIAANEERNMAQIVSQLMNNTTTSERKAS